jgi:hypothetical protein
MPLCSKCRNFFPPQFVKKVTNTDYLCVFCEKGVDEITYGTGNVKKITKDQVVNEYKKFIRMVKEDSNVLKRSVKL